MCDINTMTILGRLVRDPDQRSSAGGGNVSAFSVAANHRYKTAADQWQEEAAFVPCVAFGRTADRIACRKKGETVLVVGRLRTETWQQDGVQRSRLVLVVENLHLVQIARSAPKPDADIALPESVEKAVPF
jgi:single-strand DNA-binding protein